jgi:hypothetical protein
MEVKNFEALKELSISPNSLCSTQIMWCSEKYGLYSFDHAVSEEKIFLEINQSETRMACGGHVC